MDFITKTTAAIMPIVQHSFFKTGCYVIALLTIIALLYFFIHSRKKNREALKKKEIISESHPWTAAISIIFFMSLSFGILADITDWNKSGKITVLDNGKVITQPKVYLAMGAKPIAVYDRTQTYTPSKAPEKEEPVKLEFADYGSAEANYEFRMDLPEEPEQIKKIHQAYGSQEKLLSTGIRPFIAEAMKIGALLLKVDESSTDKEKKLLRLVKDQLDKGLYVVDKGKIKIDETGRTIRKRASIIEYRVRLSDFKIENFQYEELLKKLVQEKDKIVEVLKGGDVPDISTIWSINGIQQEIEKDIEASKDLSRDQKNLIIQSISSFKNILVKLRERDKKMDKREEKKED